MKKRLLLNIFLLTCLFVNSYAAFSEPIENCQLHTSGADWILNLQHLAYNSSPEFIPILLTKAEQFREVPEFRRRYQAAFDIVDYLTTNDNLSEEEKQYVLGFFLFRHGFLDFAQPFLDLANSPNVKLGWRLNSLDLSARIDVIRGNIRQANAKVDIARAIDPLCVVSDSLMELRGEKQTFTAGLDAMVNQRFINNNQERLQIINTRRDLYIKAPFDFMEE